MIKKYIVKNCPNYMRGKSSNYCDLDAGHCQDRTNCLIKQVIEVCKDVEGYSDFAFGQRDKADEILQLFKIEDDNNEKN